MSKRRLSQQQERRIRSARDRRVAEANDDLGETLPGLVIARYGKRALVEDEDGQRRQCFLRANLDSVVAGDRVAWRASEDGGVIDARADRTSVLSRPDARGNMRPVAANIDLMLIVIAPKPPAHANLIDRYLVAAEHEGIDAVLVLNKQDLLVDGDDIVSLAESYQALGYPVVRTDKVSDPDAQALREIIEEQTMVLVGQSGVGKSSLINRLLPGLDIRTGALSEAIDKGRHTTTAAELYHLPGGGALIDSPGIREFHLHHLCRQDVANGFVEFKPFLGTCKFRDCSHDHEQGCALLQAIEVGIISEERFASYRMILDSPDI